MEGVRSLYGYTMNALKVEQLNERLINLNEIYVISIINIIFFIIFALSLKMLVNEWQTDW